MSYESRLKELTEHIGQIEYIRNVMNSVLFWDKITNMPSKGIAYRSKQLGFLAEESHKLFNDHRFRELLNELKGDKRNTFKTERMIAHITRGASFINSIPEKEYGEYISLISLSEKVWSEARKSGELDNYNECLRRIMNKFRNFADYWGYKEHPYDALMGYYDEGLTVRKLEKMVDSLKPGLQELIGYERNNTLNYKPPILISADIEKQKMLWQMLLKRIGFKADSGRVDPGECTTIVANSPGDVRIVTTYDKDNIYEGIFNVLHSGGKGVYQQSIDPSLLGTMLCEASSNYIEEAVGRLYENIIGRSSGFWEYVFKESSAIIPELDSKECGFDEFMRSINIHEPSPIRINADEVSYLMHIIVRYEIERDLISGELKIDDLAEVWTLKYEKYLGVKPKNHLEGPIQDVHWASGYVGYFPTYIAANLTSAELSSAVEKECGNLDDILAEGEFEKINNWLRENIFRFGALYTPDELLERSIKKEVEANSYLNYLKRKVGD